METIDINKELREKRKILRKMQKELQRLEELKNKQLKINSPEIKEIAQLIQELAADRATTTDAVLELIMQAIEKYPLKRKKSRSRGPVPPKYRNPDNPGETWTGRGRQPKWVEEALKKYTLEDLKIKEA